MGSRGLLCPASTCFAPTAHPTSPAPGDGDCLVDFIHSYRVQSGLGRGNDKSNINSRSTYAWAGNAVADTSVLKYKISRSESLLFCKLEC